MTNPSGQRVTLSLCEFQDGTFELYIIDPKTRQEIQITGARAFTAHERDMIARLMPGCVFTTYEQVSK